MEWRSSAADHDPNNKGVLKVNPDEKEIMIKDFFKKCLELGSAGKVVSIWRNRGFDGSSTPIATGKAWAEGRTTSNRS
ncbi:MAG: hypothetical protein U0935_20395 [Pirellulales bacterium]